MLDLLKGTTPTVASPFTINQWLDTLEQVEFLIREYLTLLKAQIELSIVNEFDLWMKTIQEVAISGDYQRQKIEARQQPLGIDPEEA
jgi:hypothetical protein